MTKVNDTKIVDIHGLTSNEAKICIEKEINASPNSIKKIVVIHGYNKGNVLQETVHKKIHSQRILEISPSFVNEGASIIYLK